MKKLSARHQIVERPPLEQIKYFLQSKGYLVHIENGELAVFKENRSVVVKEIRGLVGLQLRRTISISAGKARFDFVTIKEK